MIEINDLVFGYPGQELIFDGFKAFIGAGEHIHLYGPSGAGKTTLMRITAGLEKPLSGTVKNDAERISPVFQEDRLMEDETVLKNILLGNRGKDPSEIMRAMKIDHLAHKTARDLSGGEKRRTALCRALLHGGDLLILDEPFNGVDPENIDICINAVKKYAAGATILLATHHPEQAAKLGCRMINLGR